MTTQDSWPDHPIANAYMRCSDWSIERIERWAHNAIQVVEFDTATGYLLALLLQQALARKTEDLRQTFEQKFTDTLQRLQKEDLAVVLHILIQVTETLTVRPDFDINDKELDIITAATLRLVDLIGNGASPLVLSALHAVGNVYQSQLRYAELSEIRKRELMSFMPKHDRFQSGGKSLLELWQDLSNEGQLDKAQLCLNDLCDQIGETPHLGHAALCDILVDLCSASLAEQKLERIDLIVDAALRLAKGSAMSSDAVQSTSEMLGALSAQLEGHNWRHEAGRLCKQNIELLLDKVPSAFKITALLKTTMRLIGNDPRNSDLTAYMTALNERAADKDVPAEFRNFLDEQLKQSDEVQKVLEEFHAKLAKAKENDDPEKCAREFMHSATQALRQVDMSHLQPILMESLLMYRTSPLAKDPRSVAHHVWDLAWSLSSQKPAECAEFLRELTALSLDRIKRGEVVKAYGTSLNNIRLHNSGSAVSIDDLYSALRTSQVPDNRLDGIDFEIRAIDPNNRQAVSELFDYVVKAAPEASRENDGDECQAIESFLSLARHFRPRSGEGTEEKFEFLAAQSLKYYKNCSNDQHARQSTRRLLAFGGQNSDTALLLQLLAVIESKKLEAYEESEVDRSLLTHINKLARSSREEAEKTLIAAIEIREASKGPNSERLLPLLHHRLSQLAYSKRISECEEVQRRMTAIRSAQPQSEDAKQSDQVNQALVYIHSDLPEQAEALWKPILEKCVETGPSSSHIGTIRQLIHLTNSYLQRERLDISEDILIRILPLLDENSFSMFDQTLNQLITKYKQFGRVEHLERLYLASINAPRRSALDANQYRIMLSELYLGTGSTLESRVMFEEAVRFARLQGIDTRTLLHARASCLIRNGFSEEVSELGLDFSSTKKPPCFEFALFGVQEVRLSGNTQVGSYKSSSNVRPGRGNQSASAHVGSYGSVHLEHNATVFGSIVQPPPSTNSTAASNARDHHRQLRMDAIARARGISNEGSLPAPVLATYSFASVPPIPDGAVTLDARRQLTQADMGSCDFVASELNGAWLRRRNSGTTRIFLTDDAGTGASALSFNHLHDPNGKPRELQIWYNGTREIVINSPTMCATVYAPNATVRIDGNAIVAGAILANRIICGGNACICFDEELAGQPL